ncbi:MAG: cytochrome c oxidase accessory protein CcoG [Sulfuriferula sp.]|nr:cytochrome c oxidase accessory protein CcoG [Sulfuriferula sp.]
MTTGTTHTIKFYDKAQPIVTRSVKGKFRNFKSFVLVLAYSIYFGLPWLPWHRIDAASQAVMFDLDSRRFFIFDLVVYPQNVFWLAILLFIAAVILFFATTLIGRAFCGYFCFQTLWTDLFIWVEQFIQGERPARLRLKKQAWDAEKILKVGGTHLVWLLIAFWTGMTFVLYYGYAPDLLHRFFIGQAATAAYIGVIGLMLSTYAAAAFMREQICAYVCPYGRFQSVMYEAETLAVAYDVRRGEGEKGRISPKGDLKDRTNRVAQGHGDCIDCGFCVQVCPAGIDIREGLQYRCISCGLCIDACNNIMDSMGYPQGLIRYDSEANLAQDKPKPAAVSWKRWKVAGYLTAILVMTAGLFYSVHERTEFEVSVQQIRQPLFVILSSGEVRNRYQIHLTNKTDHNVVYSITAKNLPANALDIGAMQNVTVHSGKSVIVQASVKLQPELADKYKNFEFVIQSLTNPADKSVEAASFYNEHPDTN